jgi:hypothetical protein
MAYIVECCKDAGSLEMISIVEPGLPEGAETKAYAHRHRLAVVELGVSYSHQLSFDRQCG